MSWDSRPDAPSATGYHSALARWLLFLLDHVAPATLFMLAAIGHLYGLLEILEGRGPATGVTQLEQFWLLANKTATAIFITLVAVLFAIRRPRTGNHPGLIPAIALLAIHPGDRQLQAQVSKGLLPALVALAGTNILVLASLAPVTHTTEALVIPATLVVVFGLLFSLWALASLGRCFGVFPEARGLVRRGPYRWVRHPLYLAEIISATGWLLLNASPYTVGLFIAFVALQYQRAIFEEQVLEVAFPEYQSYRGGTWRILPGIH